jgi:hypothetical protein
MGKSAIHSTIRCGIDDDKVPNGSGSNAECESRDADAHERAVAASSGRIYTDPIGIPAPVSVVGYHDLIGVGV